MIKIIELDNGYKLTKIDNRGYHSFIITTDEAIELFQRFDRDFEADAVSEEIQYQAEMVRRAKAAGL